MSLFRNILVGVDVTQYDAATFQPSAVAEHVVRQALWLAGNTSARLTFFSALDLGIEALPHLDETDFHYLTTEAEQTAAKILRGLVQQAHDKGIEAADKLALGSGWLELVREVLRDHHDLVLIGTRDRTGLGRMLFGSTAVKVVRRCPCPVWVAKPDGEPSPVKILVASGLDAVAEEGLRLAAGLARVAPAVIHLLHAVDFPLDRHWSTGLPDAKEEAYRRRVREHAVMELEGQIDRAGARSLSPRVQVHLVDEVGVLPDEGILKFIHQHAIDLLVMGTIARSGMAGVMIGNTAERLLPELSCSLLAVKPKDFVSPVRL
ncbi:MAG TPA: universal stress protein [Gemmataceae bacterium]|nr:universal stress protein [Gemmataceae bacterium]